MIVRRLLCTLRVGEMAKLDVSRVARCGFPEVIFAEGKSATQVSEIMLSMLRAEQWPIIASRVSAEQYALCQIRLGPELLKYHQDSRILYIENPQQVSTSKNLSRMAKVSVLSAGTSDYRVASEAALLLRLTLPAGIVEVKEVNDVGVAGLHRLLSQLPSIEDSDVIIVAAGMDGALPSVVGGLVKCPVIAVPTSVGYGAAFGGVAALLTMLNTCAPGVTVVNIDNGFGAAVAAHKMLKSGVLRTLPVDPTQGHTS